MYDDELTRQRTVDRSAEPGTGAGGAGTAIDTHRYWNCLTSVDTALGSPERASGFKAFGEVMLNPAKCDSRVRATPLGCQMHDEFESSWARTTI